MWYPLPSSPAARLPSPEVVHGAVGLGLYHPVLCDADPQVAGEPVGADEDEGHAVAAADAVQRDRVRFHQLQQGIRVWLTGVKLLGRRLRPLA